MTQKRLPGSIACLVKGNGYGMKGAPPLHHPVPMASSLPVPFTTSTTTERQTTPTMDDDDVRQGELQLLHTELEDLRRRNVKKAIATDMPPMLAIDLKLNLVLAQLYPEAMDRLRFELHYEEQLREKLQGWELGMRQANAARNSHPAQQLFRPGGGHGHG